MSWRRHPLVLALIALAIGFGVGVFVPNSLTSGSLWYSEEEYENQNQYRFISPLLSCGEGKFNHLGNAESTALEESLEAAIANMKAESMITDAGIYFRELNGGPWVGVNYDAQFTPGSLLKVPLAMSVYHLAEEEPGLLTEEIAFEGGSAPADQYFKAELLVPGVYTVEELIRRSITQSDNTAAVLLSEIIGINEVEESYARLGIQEPRTGVDYATSVRTYASFFRILYNATYLDRGSSEHLLSLLAETNFNAGIVAGVPPGTVVAHKFGERALPGEALVQLHDCGIVYHPTQPYLFCAMMRGKDFDTLAQAIASLSKLVYDSIN